MDTDNVLENIGSTRTDIDNIRNRVNRISEKFADKVRNAEELIVCGEDLESTANDVLSDVKKLPVSDNTEYHFNINLLPQILNLENMMSDVRYIRETLKENADLGRRLLKMMAQELEFEPDAELLASYSQLSMTITDNMKLFLQCYKDISNILMNISKLTKQEAPNTVINNVTIENDRVKIQNTAELIKQLSRLKN
jgi:hypothetical protein